MNFSTNYLTIIVKASSGSFVKVQQFICADDMFSNALETAIRVANAQATNYRSNVTVYVVGETENDIHYTVKGSKGW